MQTSPLTMSLLSTQMVAPGVKHFVLHASAPFKYIPGQFLTINFEVEGKVIKRSYSIANPPDELGQIEFAASYIEGGVGSQYLFGLEPGAKLSVAGPYGRLLLKDTPRRYVLVGTGTGITPYRAMLPQLKEKLALDVNMQLVVLQGVRTREDLLYVSDFRLFAANNPRTLFRACLSREPIEQLTDDEWQGHVQNNFEALHLDPNQDLVYLCGNPQMIDESFAWLIEHGFAVQQVVREKYISK